jgi:hypothetical protein
MEGKSSFLTGEVSYVTPKPCSNVRMTCEKSAEVIVVKKSGKSQKERRAEQSYQLLKSRLRINVTSGVFSTLLKSMAMTEIQREERR